MWRWLCILLLPGWLGAHGELHERIARLSARIEKDPTNVGLRLQRGELHRLHRDFAEAEADLEAAARLDPRRAEVDLVRARLWGDAGRPREALQALRRYELSANLDVSDVRMRAGLLGSLEEWERAAEAWAFVTFSREATPDDFLARTAVVLRRGWPLESAVGVLDDGMRRLGPIPALELKAIALLLEACVYDEALERIEVALKRAKRPESWLEWRARVLTSAGRAEEAAAAARAGLAAIEALPAVRRDTAAAQSLASRLRGYLPP